MKITNEFACAPTQIEKACVIIEVEREGLGNDLVEIRENAREIADKIVADGVILFSPEFYFPEHLLETTNSCPLP